MKLDTIVRWAFWSPPLRILLFVAVFLGAYGRSDRLPIVSQHSDPARVAEVFREIASNDISNVSNPDFAYALATEIVRVATGVAVAFLISHVCVTLVLLVIARVRLARVRTAQEFQIKFEKMSWTLSDDFLVGEAWAAYAKTFVREQVRDQVRHYATVRPQAYLNASVARDHMFGLRLMPSIPGYFVGLGLLLTFVGLVIALSKAAHGSGASADAMTASLKELLNAATFKFATSIAGLFSSLVLALLFRSYAILIERGFERLCRTLEPRLIYLTSQDLALRSHTALLEQKALLQEMTTAQYMQRLGAAVGEAVGTAVGNAVGNAMGGADNERRQGLEDLVQQFLEALRGSAGQEMTALVEVLKTTTDALKNMRQDLAESGDKFAERMDVASAAFAELIRKAGGDLGRVTGEGRTSIEEAMKALVSASEDMRRRLEENTKDAGENANAALQAAMKEVLANLSAQMEAFRTTLADFRMSLLEGGKKSADDTKNLIGDTTKAADDAAKAVRESFGALLEGLRRDTERVSGALTSAEQTFSSIAGAARETVGQSNAAAEAFGRVAENVERSSRPLLDTAGRIEGAVERLTTATTQASASLEASQASARELANALGETLGRLEATWRGYAEKFDGVDAALAASVQALAEQTEQYQTRLREFVAQVDTDLGKSVTKLEAIATNLTSGVDDLSDHLETLIARLDK